MKLKGFVIPVGFFIAVFFLFSCAGSQVTPSKEEVNQKTTAERDPEREAAKAVLELLLESEGFLNQIPVQKTSPMYEPYIGFLKKVFRNDEYIDAMLQLISDAEGKVSDYEKLGAAWAMELGLQGVKRLNDQESQALFSILTNMLEVSSATECAGLFREEITLDDSDFILRNLEKLPKYEINQYFDLQFKAMLAEIRGYPQPLTVLEKQTETAYEYLFNQIPMDDRIQIAFIMLDLNSYSDVEVCWAVKKQFNTILSLRDPYKTWIIRDFITSD